MNFFKSLPQKFRFSLNWFIEQIRIVRGDKNATLNARLIAAITILCIVMIMIFGVKLIRSFFRESIIIATAGEGGEYYQFGKSIEKVFKNHRGILVEAKSSLGSSENMQLLEKGKVELAIVQHDTPVSPSVQSVASLFPEVLHLIVDESINSITEMKGKRIAVIPNILTRNNNSDDPNSFCRQFFRRYGLEDNIEIVRIDNLKQAKEDYLNAKIDGIMIFIAVGNDCICELLKQQTRLAKLLPIDIHGIEVWYPYVESAVIHRTAYWTEPAVPNEDINSVSVQALLLTNKRVYKKTIYEITRSLYEHRNELIVEDPHAATVRLPNSGDDLGIPLHIGAKAYYRREEPGFIVKYADPLALFLSLAVLSITGIWHLRTHLEMQQKSRADRYNLEILKLVEQSHRTQNLNELQELRFKLYDIFRRVLEDLDKDRISISTFHLFSFPLEVAIGAIRHHEWIVLNKSPETKTTEE